MAESLSQNQIDDLLKRMQAGEMKESLSAQESKVKDYNFASPKKFTKDQLKSLNNLNENFARVLSSYFTGVLHSICEVEISQIEEQRYYEFNNALPDSTLVGMLSFHPDQPSYDETTMMMQLAASFGFLLIDRLMGGSEDAWIPERDYTEIELALLNLVFQNITKYLQEAWSNYFPLKTGLRSVETNGRLLQAFSPQDIVVIVTLEIKAENLTTTANLCMPAENLEEIISSLSVKYAHSTKQQDENKEKIKRDLVLDYIKQSDLQMEAVLDQCQMNLSELSHLQVDDVIVLNKGIEENIEIYVEHLPWYLARVGECSGKKAVKLCKALDTFTK